MAQPVDFDAGELLDELFDRVVIIDRDFRIRGANRAFTESIHLSLADALGKNCHELLAGRDRPCSRAGFPCSLQAVFEADAPRTAEHAYEDAKGNPVFLEAKAVPLSGEDGGGRLVALILRDVTRMKRTENKLVEAALKFQRIAETSDGAVLILGPALQVEYANAKASDLIEYSVKELMNSDFQTFLDETGKRFLQDHLKDGFAEEDRRDSAEVNLVTAKGKRRSCEISVSSVLTGEKERNTYVFLRDLTEQMRMERKFREANEFLSNLIESSVDGIIAADMTGTTIVFNKGAENLLGYKAEEVIGKFSAVDFYPPGVAQDIMRKLRDEEFGGKGKLLPSRITGIDKTGEHIPITLSGALIYQDGREVASVGIFYDLREILKAEKELMESESNFRDLFERVRHGIYFSTREGKLLDSNMALSDMLGYDKKEDFLTVDIAQDLYFVPSDRAEFVRMIERDGHVKDYEVNFKKKNGEPNPVLLTAHVRKDSAGKVLGYQGIVIDVAERRKLEQQLFQTEKLAAMGRLTAQIAHELNNPIYGVMNCLDLLKSEVPADSKKRRFLDMAYGETKRISQLLRSMLKFFRPDEDVKTQVDVNALIEEVLLFVGKQLREFKIKVELELQDGLPLVFASGNQTKQVMLNMIMNARNAMPNGGTLRLSTARREGDLLVRIADTGVGIPAENLDRIFEAFFTTKSDVKGVGLGLSVCFGIVREHNGKIDVESEPGVGTAFTVILPFGP